MKKLIITLFVCVVYGMPTYGANVCAKTGTYISVFKKDVNGTSAYNPDTAVKSWRVTFDYDNDGTEEKTITGLAACNGISGTFGIPVTNLYTNASDVGGYCWCKMEPVADNYLGTTAVTGVTSYWIFARDYTTISETPETSCASDCAATCGTWIGNNTNDFRYKLFEAIW